MQQTLFDNQMRMLEATRLTRITGSLTEVSGLTLVARGLPLAVGDVCVVSPADREPVHAQVIGFRGERTILMPLTDPMGTAAGDPVTSAALQTFVSVGERLLGRVLDGLGRPVDGRGQVKSDALYPLYAAAPPALSRRQIDTPLATGIRSIDAMLTLGTGQRMGLFAGTGVGKSVLMGMVARNTDADVIVIGLVGERGREVGDFLRRDLGEEGVKRAVMVVSTSNESPVLRVRACHVATAVAEYFRDQGCKVLLLMDSVTRMAMAQRQIGLAAGEPPATKGYPPSVFALLPQLLERAGQASDGSITGLYTVLTEGDDLNDPIADAVRGVLDGHVWLSRALANAGHYPAVSVLESVSRVMVDVVDDAHQAAARAVRRVLATWADIEDLVNIGAYTKGANPEFDLAVAMKGKIGEFLRQHMSDSAPLSTTRQRLMALHDEIRRVEGEVRRGQPSPGGTTGDATEEAIEGA